MKWLFDKTKNCIVFRGGVLEEDNPIPKGKKYIFEGKSKLFFKILFDKNIFQ